MKPFVTIREHDVETGKFVQNTNSLRFGNVLPASRSDIKLIDLVINGVRGVSNLNISLTDSAGIEVAPSGEISGEYALSGNFGIETNSVFSVKDDLTTFFKDVNSSVSVGITDEAVSDYIWLDVAPGNTIRNNVRVKWALNFDYIDQISSSSSQSSSSSSSGSSSCSSCSSSCNSSSSTSSSSSGLSSSSFSCSSSSSTSSSSTSCSSSSSPSSSSLSSSSCSSSSSNSSASSSSSNSSASSSSNSSTNPSSSSSSQSSDPVAGYYCVESTYYSSFDCQGYVINNGWDKVYLNSETYDDYIGCVNLGVDSVYREALSGPYSTTTFACPFE